MKRNTVADLEQDIYGYMPEKFVVMYSELVRRGLAQMGSSLKGQGEGGTRQKYKTHNGGLLDPAALEQKRDIDQKLRQITRGVEQEQARDVKCSRCGRGCGAKWKHCAWCGWELAVVHSEARVTPQPSADARVKRLR